MSGMVYKLGILRKMRFVMLPESPSSGIRDSGGPEPVPGRVLSPGQGEHYSSFNTFLSPSPPFLNELKVSLSSEKYSLVDSLFYVYSDSSTVSLFSKILSCMIEHTLLSFSISFRFMSKEIPLLFNL